MQTDSIILQPVGTESNAFDSVPQYYRENFFSSDSLYHPTLEGGRYGVAGDPIPYVIGNDDIISSLLLACFVVTLLAFSISKSYIYRQTRDFFYWQKTEEVHDITSGEMRALVFFTFQTCLMVTLLYFFYVRAYIADTFILSDEYQLIGIIFGIVVVYFCLRPLLYSMVNLTFFNGKGNGQFLQNLFYLTAAEGAVLYPAVLLQSYFNIPLPTTGYYCLLVLFLVKFLTFYKSYTIFFRQNEFFLQIILYFCALEIIPMLALWGGLAVIINTLKINF